MLLITGSTGFVGRHLVSALEGHSPTMPAPGLHYLAVGGPASGNSPERLDLRDPSMVAALFRRHRFNGIIHLAAESRTGECEKDPEKAYSANTNATRNLLQAAAPQSPWFLYVSTDMVFSGHKGDYTETDHPNPINHYGRSKAQAEQSVQHYPGEWCIVRPAVIYGAPADGRSSMLTWTIDTLRNGTGAFFVDEIRTPIWVDDLVRLLIGLYRSRHRGIVHAGGPDKVSRFEFAKIVAATWGISESCMKSAALADQAGSDWRPRDLSLSSFEAAKYQRMTPLNEALAAIQSTGLL